MHFITVQLKCGEELSEILQALIGNIGFDSFLEDENGFEASIEKDQYAEEELKEVLAPFEGQIEYTVREEEKKNWNKLWEENYDMVEISEELIIRASFHKPEKPYPYEIVINPKMSFGTGHHPTTTLMLRNQLKLDHKDKIVADLGAGTGILAIMAKKLGAKLVDACDIEEWAVENAIENAKINEVDFDMTQGTVQEMTLHAPYDIVIANINRNVLLTEMQLYAEMLKENGTLLLSGFYTEDIETMQAEAEKHGLSYESHLELRNWVSMRLKKG
ncbi:50S ribosomal protein L11 methyltransferase [Sediminitomix flava]|uniref:Ribosomal protein L11 methyltransferase n=1 Tax=Sediminitomix flava TaxID=379075 RepID=A0A316A110_SEDFL|nr:50S ribosomal protein L11 methyltransferase [Sediminitomix flava]PWJ43347.1 [LSU ribosomal protein L11P]-lysine N-methyltransferase [Sediminitomix flava]